MPPVTYKELLEKNKQGKDLFSQKGKPPLRSLYRDVLDAINAAKKAGKIKNEKVANQFAYALFDVQRDPAAKDELSEQEKRDKRFHPDEPTRPLRHTNRNAIELAINDLEGATDFLGSVKGEGLNQLNVILDYADEPDSIVEGLNLINDTLQLGLPMKELESGRRVESSPQERSDREKRRKALEKAQSKREQVYEAKLKEIESYKLQKKKLSKEIDDAAEQEENERLRKQREKREQEEQEKKRREEEARKSDEQKKKEAEERKEQARQLQLKNRQAMQKALAGSITVFRDPKASPELKKVNMAMAAAFHAELERVGPGGDVAIDEGRVKQDMENFYNSAEFAIAEEKGELEELTALEPEQLRQRITQREQAVSAGYVEGEEADRQRAGKLWERFSATYRMAKNSEQFNKARDAMKAYSEKKTAPTRADNYLAAETVKRYVSKNISKAHSDTGKERMAISLAFLKQTMTPASFQAYCSSLNAQRGFTPSVGENGKLVYNTTDDRYIDPKTVGTVDEVYNETRERLGAASRGEAELDTRDLAMMTTLSALRKNGGDRAVEKSALEAEIKKVEKDPRFRDALKNDTPEALIDKAWKKQLDTLEGYAQPAPQQNAPQIS